METGPAARCSRLARTLAPPVAASPGAWFPAAAGWPGAADKCGGGSARGGAVVLSVDDLGGERANPLIPADLVIDHSVQVDEYGNETRGGH